MGLKVRADRADEGVERKTMNCDHISKATRWPALLPVTSKQICCGKCGKILSAAEESEVRRLAKERRR